MKKTLLVLLGPTGIGKSELSIHLAKGFQIEIISCDSRQIYRELSVGTAVPPPESMQKVKHHLIHSHSLHEYYSASRFESDVLSLLEQLFRDKNTVLMTGGSMLYIDAVCRGLDELPEADPELRAALLREYQEKGIEHLRLQLRQLDPDYYGQVDLKNPKRLLHALEICMSTGKPYSCLRTNTQKKRPFSILKIGLNMERSELYRRINARVDCMLENGLEEEARRVYAYRKLNALNTVGYKEMFSFFDGKTSRNKAVELIKRNSRRYARRQLSWFRRDPEIHWFSPLQQNEISRFIQSKLS
ncbi:MAG: tRNA (adenosine(37)-N6)-dimethylallyltransferase MiaA [Mangrovibacterium sp.]